MLSTVSAVNYGEQGFWKNLKAYGLQHVNVGALAD
jgi:hypothetical protein